MPLKKLENMQTAIALQRNTVKTAGEGVKKVTQEAIRPLCQLFDDMLKKLPDLKTKNPKSILITTKEAFQKLRAFYNYQLNFIDIENKNALIQIDEEYADIEAISNLPDSPEKHLAINAIFKGFNSRLKKLMTKINKFDFLRKKSFEFLMEQTDKALIDQDLFGLSDYVEEILAKQIAFYYGVNIIKNDDVQPQKAAKKSPKKPPKVWVLNKTS